MEDDMDQLAIPEFLRRPRGSAAVSRALSDMNRQRWERRKPQRPDGDSWATAVLRDVWLQDECAPIGSGRRLVWVREGRKWCKLASLDGTRVKIPMALWKQIARRVA